MPAAFRRPGQEKPGHRAVSDRLLQVRREVLSHRLVARKERVGHPGMLEGDNPAIDRLEGGEDEEVQRAPLLPAGLLPGAELGLRSTLPPAGWGEPELVEVLRRELELELDRLTP